jgi:hypothetical protein
LRTAAHRLTIPEPSQVIRFAFPLRQGSEDCGVHVEYAVVVLGVPTFINDERAVLVAITAGPSGDGALATITINGWSSSSTASTPQRVQADAHRAVESSTHGGGRAAE